MIWIREKEYKECSNIRIIKGKKKSMKKEYDQRISFELYFTMEILCSRAMYRIARIFELYIQFIISG